MQRLLSGELKEVFYLKFLRKLQCITAAIMISVSSMAFPLTVRADVSNEDMLVVAQIEAEMEAQAKQAQASQLQAAVEPVAAKAEEAVQSVGAVVQEAAVAVAEPVQEAVQAPELLSLVGSAATDAGWLTAESYGTRPESRDALNAQTRSAIWAGSVLSKLKGTNYGPSGKESWYNMSRCLATTSSRLRTSLFIPAARSSSAAWALASFAIQADLPAGMPQCWILRRRGEFKIHCNDIVYI